MTNTLICGCGPHHVKLPGQTLLDIRPFPNVDTVHDLSQRFPFDDGSYTSISALHVVEHLPNLIHFMDECHRVLAPGGTLYLETPLAGADLDLEFADPTHVRCYRKHTFINYFTPEGIVNFGYTDKAWCILALELIHNDTVIKFHGMPIKK